MLGNWNRLRETRKGIMLHYDDSASDASGIYWLTKDERCKVSYNFVVDDHGKPVQITPLEARAWHGGVCTSSDPRLLKYHDANSAFYGVAALANGKDTATPAQVAGIVKLCVRLFRRHGWPASETWRIVTHRSEASPRDPSATPPKWRKVDCEGNKPKGMVLDPNAVRMAVAMALNMTP